MIQIRLWFRSLPPVRGISPENIKVTPQYLSVRLEEKVTQEFLVNVNYGSSQPGKGYEVGSSDCKSGES